MQSPLKMLSGTVLALALCVSSTTAAAATIAPTQSISPLIAVSVMGSQASAQEACANPATAAAAGAAAAVAQGQTGCVLPAVDTAPPPPVQSQPAVLPPPAGTNYGINWLLLGLGLLALAGGLSTLFDDDDDDGVSSPA